METHNINVIACSDLGVQEVRAATHRGPGGSPAALPALMRCYMIPARLPYEEGHRLSESQRPVAIQNKCDVVNCNHLYCATTRAEPKTFTGFAGLYLHSTVYE